MAGVILLEIVKWAIAGHKIFKTEATGSYRIATTSRTITHRVPHIEINTIKGEITGKTFPIAIRMAMNKITLIRCIDNPQIDHKDPPITDQTKDRAISTIEDKI